MTTNFDDQQITPTFSSVINASIDRKLIDLHTMMPCVIKSVDFANKTATVIPSFKRKYSDNTSEEIAPIQNVPIGFFQTNNSIISLPLAPGEDAMIIFSERSLDIWKKTGGIKSPEDARRHDLTDAVVVPALKPIGTGIPADPNYVLIKHGQAEIKMSKNGFTINNQEAELLGTIESLISGILADLTIINFYSPTPLGLGVYPPLISAIQSLKL